MAFCLWEGEGARPEPCQVSNSPCQGPGLSFSLLEEAGAEQPQENHISGTTNQQAPDSLLLAQQMIIVS